jgi:hypothetical protein
MNVRLAAGVMLAGSLLFPGPVFAATAMIDGRVLDATGVPIAGAVVSASEGGRAAQTATTDAQGRYVLTIADAGRAAVTIAKPGYRTATESAVVLARGAAVILNVTLRAATLGTLQDIGHVSSTSQSAGLNTSPASTVILSQATFTDQGFVQPQRILDETPGIVTSHTGTGNNADFGNVESTNIRGSLDYEKATLLDGHPLANGKNGDYVISFLDNFVFDTVEIIKGPGANAPEINYGIGGTINFRTLEPTRTSTGSITLGADSYGGQFSNFRASNTIGKFSYVVDYAVDGSQGPLLNAPTYVTLPNGSTIGGIAGTVSGTTSANALNGVTPATQFPVANGQNNPANGNASLVACCEPVSTQYLDHVELTKLRYAFSPSTSATFTYLGEQAQYNIDGASLVELPATFAPAATYAGGLTRGQALLINNATSLPTSRELFDSEPLFSGEARTTIGDDDLIARYYIASRDRVQTNDTTNPANAVTVPLQLNGTATVGGVAQTFNGGTYNVGIPAANAYFNSIDIDHQRGSTLEYDHYAGPNTYTLAYDRDTSNTDSQQLLGGTVPVASVSVAPGSQQTFSTYLARASFSFGNRFDAIFSNYYNTYRSQYDDALNAAGAFQFQTTTRYHDDPRIGLAYRADKDVALRFSAGSAVAPAYLGLLTTVTTAPVLAGNGTYATQTQNSGGLLPETSFGYDLGGDFRIAPNTVIVADGYLTNLHNQFLTVTSLGSYTPPGTTTPVPLYISSNTNLSNSRFEGIELAVRHDPSIGFGYTAQGSLEKAYPYNISQSVYAAASGPLTTNLGAIPGANFFGTNTGFTAVSNKGAPYSEGYAGIHYRGDHGALLEGGFTYYGPNNSFNLPAFAVANASIRVPIFGSSLTLAQISVDNIFNTYANDYITGYSGVAAPLVNGKIGLNNANTNGPRIVRFMLTRAFGSPEGR